VALPAHRTALLLLLAGLLVAAAAAGIFLLFRAPAPPAPAGRVDAAALYARYCAVCHGTTGKGDGPGATVVRQAIRDFTDPAAMAAVDDGFLFGIIQKGGSQYGRSNAMPAWSMKLSDPEIRELVRYLRALAAPGASGAPPRKDTP
jgi:mono/diheme cytochrome c family protein